ncbi:inovirus Gp2 family protein [Enterobacter ludwigii]|uniref:inovirus Gp2 family protein n=1 Tax=Enterobacter ludwigii TaxID=299767 RepID=UPI000643563E|nr:inovirus Gp2 family protein [Enterobacter ludwigii]KLP46333.1 hypothetical protein ABR36_01515 [Enterobacter ludwigii]
MNIDMYNKIVSLYGQISIHYLERIEETIAKSLNQYPRTFAVRFDLRFPLETELFNKCKTDSEVITRFFKSLAAMMKISDYRKVREGKRVHVTALRYVWVREFGQSGRKHYHVLLLLNKDAYKGLGGFNHKRSLADMICRAWLSATGISESERRGLVHFASYGGYWLNNKLDQDINDAIYTSVVIRVSYLAKDATKCNDDGERNFGCSCK